LSPEVDVHKNEKTRMPQKAEKRMEKEGSTKGKNDSGKAGILGEQNANMLPLFKLG